MSIVNGQLYGSIPAGELVSQEFNQFLRTHVGGAASYGGPEYWMKEPNRFYVPATTDGSCYLTSDSKGKLNYLLNVCSHYHRPVYLPDDDWKAGYMGSLTNGRSHCGGHKWGYDAEGVHHAPIKLKVARGTEIEPEQHCTNLHSAVQPEQSIEVIGGMIWIGTPKQLEPYRQILQMPLARQNGLTQFLPSNYRLVRVWIDRAPFSAFTGMVIFEDLNHPGKGVHPGKLDEVVEMRTQKRDYNPNLGISMQVVSWLSRVNYAKMSKHWADYHKCVQVVEQMGIVDHTVGKVFWIADYNGFFTIEHYPYFIVKSWFIPVSGGVRNVVEFYVPEEVLLHAPGLATAAIAAYMGKDSENGIAQEDAQLSLGCDKGMRILAAHGKGAQVIGPLDPVSDRAVYDFHKFMARRWEQDTLTNPVAM